MKERPILFSAPMVRAILSGTKTQTRRVAKPIKHPDLGNVYDPGALVLEKEHHHVIERACPYGAPFDRLWVREAIRLIPDQDPDDGLGPVLSIYDADGSLTAADAWPWKRSYLPPMHCPRGLSRIMLEITAVRVERLQDISEEDAQAEGCAPAWLDADDNTTVHAEAKPTYRQGFARLWRDIHGAGSWAANPWVWVVEFRGDTP